MYQVAVKCLITSVLLKIDAPLKGHRFLVMC